MECVWDIDICIQKLYIFHLNSILYLLSVHGWHWVNDEDDNEANIGKKHDSWHQYKSHIDDWFLYVVIFVYVYVRVHYPMVLRIQTFSHRQYHKNSMFIDIYKLCVSCPVYLTNHTKQSTKRDDCFMKKHFLEKSSKPRSHFEKDWSPLTIYSLHSIFENCISFLFALNNINRLIKCKWLIQSDCKLTTWVIKPK